MGFRSKLIISYAAVITVTVLLSVALFAFIFKQIQDDSTKKATDRLSAVTNTISESIAQPQVGRRLSLSQYQNILETYSQLLDVRILLVDSQGRVQADTETNNPATMLNQAIPGYKLVPDDNRPHDGTARLHDVQYFYYARRGPNLTSNPPVAQADRISFEVAAPLDQTVVQTDLWLAVPEASLNANWDNFLKGLIGAAALALAISIGLALIIARSISRPLVRITRASTAIAHGNYSEQLPVMGKDEMGRLAASFNRMVREVARSQQTMRDFVANVSHELKTPLTSIQGFSQAIIEGVAENPEELEHSAGVIYNEAARMRRLVDELLDLSRIESGQVALNRQELDLSQLLSRVVMKLGPLASEKNLVIQHPLQNMKGPLVLGDADRLEQVFTNILDNAVKYSRVGGHIWLEMQPTATETRPPGVKVAIGNIGPLIPPEQLGRIFERFYKLDPSRKRKGESTGLGLAITKELVEAHQGTINVTSQPLPGGQGLPGEGFTVFTITLPVSVPAPVIKPLPLNLNLRR